MELTRKPLSLHVSQAGMSTSGGCLPACCNQSSEILVIVFSTHQKLQSQASPLQDPSMSSSLENSLVEDQCPDIQQKVGHSLPSHGMCSQACLLSHSSHGMMNFARGTYLVIYNLNFMTLGITEAKLCQIRGKFHIINEIKFNSNNNVCLI